MTSGGLKIDELLCFAHRSGDQVLVQLRVTSGLESDTAAVRLTGGDRRIDASAQVQPDGDSVRVSFAVPQRRLRRVAWQISVKSPGDNRFRAVEARLLAPPDQPVALLPGPAPTTRMAPPPPRRQVSTARRAAQHLPEPVKNLLRGVRARVRSTRATRARSA